ncbi:MAG TPA: glucoamylase family protein, partial [Gemmatimonadales bacterium]|nr:glucoamylase family protein [Gemmatimonadales bacterium]
SSTRCAWLVGIPLALAACAGLGPAPSLDPGSPRAQAFLDTLEQRTFNFFWERSDPQTGLTPDRWPTLTFSSIAAVGFALTAYPIGVERGYVTRPQAAGRTLATLRWFWQAPQGSQASGTSGDHGFFYHFLDLQTGQRYQTVELSTIDTALLLGGVLFCREYFNGPDSTEVAIRATADSLYARTDWAWAQRTPPLVNMGWTPENGWQPLDWRGYNEAMLVYILALGSPTHPIDSTAWAAWSATYQWGGFYGQSHIGFAPLFGHHYTHVWIDFRGIQDEYTRAHGLDYFENSRRATLAQRAYATANPGGWAGYGTDLWGLSASDGPADVTLSLSGSQRRFFTYAARGADFTEVRDDGTVAPTAAGGSVPFAPDVAIAALIAMRERYGEWLFGTYGFLDAFNPTFRFSGQASAGQVVAGQGWFDTDYLGIDQGPILAMIENYRTDLVWKTMRKSPYIIRGLRRAGFHGGWLAQAP